MKCGNTKEHVREMQTLYADFFPWHWWAKGPLVHIGAPPRYAPGHQVSSSQEPGLATKAHPHRWRPCHKGNAHHLLHWSSWHRLQNEVSHQGGAFWSSAHRRRQRSTPSRRVDDLQVSHQDSKGPAYKDYNCGSLKNQTQVSNTLLAHSL
jgi:hypothetical protein